VKPRAPKTKPEGPPRPLRIESIAAGGAGVAHEGGRAIFVPRTAPGDLVEVAVEARGGMLHGRVLRVIEPGPGRIAPPCPFVEACGGCDLMHLSLGAQREAHRAIVADALARTGGIEDVPPIGSHVVHTTAAGDAGPAPLAYRTRARFYARVSRRKVEVGYRAEGSHQLVAIERCAVLAPALDALFHELPALLEGAAGDGEISVARGESGKPIADIAWRGALPPAVWARLDERIKSGAWAGARVWLDGAKTPASFGDPRPVVMGADGRPLVVAAGGFAQPSDEASAALARLAADLVRKSGDALGSVVELYAGSGTLSILLAPLASRFVAVESDEDSVRAARQNLEARGLAGKVVAADAGAHDPGRADVVVLDPPRTGARAAAERIAASPARAVVYVACEPTTMARDVALLTAAGFGLTDVETVEIFPQTSHVETHVRLARGRRKGAA
jgi:23S rRNA (uracil1939-C5)-methyltransferase